MTKITKATGRAPVGPIFGRWQDAWFLDRRDGPKKWTCVQRYRSEAAAHSALEVLTRQDPEREYRVSRGATFAL